MNKKYYVYIGIALSVILAVWYFQLKYSKYRECCNEKTKKETTMVIENHRLDSLLEIKDTVYIQISKKTNGLKKQAHEINAMVIITNSDSILNSLSRLSEPPHNKK